MPQGGPVNNPAPMTALTPGAVYQAGTSGGQGGPTAGFYRPKTNQELARDIGAQDAATIAAGPPKPGMVFYTGATWDPMSDRTPTAGGWGYPQSNFDALVGNIGGIAKTVAPIVLTALGANYVLPELMGVAGTAGGAAGAGAGAGAAGTGAAGAGAAGAGAAGALTPAALESLIGTAGYGASAAAGAGSGAGAYAAGLGAAGMGAAAPSGYSTAAADLLGGMGVAAPTSTGGLASVNEMVASGMSPGSVGAAGAAGTAFTPAELAAATGTLPAATSINEMVASGMSPGSAGAQGAVDGTLTGSALDTAYGVNNAASTLSTLDVLNAIQKAKGLFDKGAKMGTSGDGTGSSDSSGTGIDSALARVGKMGSGDMLQRPIQQLYNNTNSPNFSTGGSVDDITRSLLADSASDSAAPVAGTTSKVGDVGKGGPLQRAVQQMERDYLKEFAEGGHNVIPELVSLIRSRATPQDRSHPHYDGVPLLRTGGLPGPGGKYVEGKGDGTSDDIAAMLANGEYVFSADVVAALGNGSNKAGAQELDRMVRAIRSRARSAPPDKLPPDAKSPLEYMQSSKGKKYG